MERFAKNLLVVRAFYELLRYDLIDLVFGFPGIIEALKRTKAKRTARVWPSAEVCHAVEMAACFYGKRVRCLQMSTVTARLLRRQGIPAELVVGYHPVPFHSHAWVELSDRTINDSSIYGRQLRILLRA